MAKTITPNHPVIDMLFKSPETGKKLQVCSVLTNNEDGSYSFLVGNKEGERWKHTIKTEEM